MNNWNGFDFIIFLIFVVNTIQGMSRGATKEIISLMSLSAALMVTIKFTVPLAAFFNQSPLMGDVVNNQWMQNFMHAIGAGELTENLLTEIWYSISILICFVGTFSICEGALAVTGFVQTLSFPYAALNTKIGGSLGFLRGFVFTLILLVILNLHLFRYTNNFVTGSYFAGLFKEPAIRLDSMITGQKPEDYQKIFEYRNLYTPEQLMKQLGVPASGVPFNYQPQQGQPSQQQPRSQQFQQPVTQPQFQIQPQQQQQPQQQPQQQFQLY